jgi:hypothetical protein
MSIIDRQRRTAVTQLESIGYRFDGLAWVCSSSNPTAPGLIDEADAMHALLVLRADALGGCIKGSEDEAELERIADTVTAYEGKRWPEGKVPGGKG